MKFARGNRFARGGKRQGSGRKTLLVRQMCAQSFKKRIRILCQIADNEANAPRDRIAAITLLAKIGLPSQHEVRSDAAPQFHPITFGGPLDGAESEGA